jgi:regulatory protein YycI of two-component signal transduction system YycFG
MSKKIEITKPALIVINLILLVLVVVIIIKIIPSQDQYALEDKIMNDNNLEKTVVLDDEVEMTSIAKKTVKGIDVTVEKVTRQDNKTIVQVAMSNHRFDLADPGIVDRTSLDGVTASDFEILTTEMGGHHVKGELTFNGELTGNLEIGINEDIIFNFEQI